MEIGSGPNSPNQSLNTPNNNSNKNATLITQEQSNTHNESNRIERDSFDHPPSKKLFTNSNLVETNQKLNKRGYH
jgi:hypothetical protein